MQVLLGIIIGLLLAILVAVILTRYQPEVRQYVTTARNLARPTPDGLIYPKSDDDRAVEEMIERNSTRGGTPLGDIIHSSSTYD